MARSAGVATSCGDASEHDHHHGEHLVEDGDADRLEVLDDGDGRAAPTAAPTVHGSTRGKTRPLNQTWSARCIHRARAAGARVIGSELGPERTELCLAYGVELAIDVAADDIVAIVKEDTGGRGADVIIDPVGGDVFDASYRCVAPEGRILISGFTSGRIPELRLNQVLLRNFAVIGINALFDKEQWAEFLAEIVELYAAGAVMPEVEGEYPLDALPDLCDRLQLVSVQGKAGFESLTE